MRTIGWLTKLDAFFGYPDDPIVIAEAHVLGHPDTLTVVTMVPISNTSYLSPSIHQCLASLIKRPLIAIRARSPLRQESTNDSRPMPSA